MSNAYFSTCCSINRIGRKLLEWFSQDPSHRPEFRQLRADVVPIAIEHQLFDNYNIKTVR